MKIIIYILSAIFSSAALAAVPGINTPVPVQSGFPDNCEGFAMAIPGDTCDSLASRHGLEIPTLINLNPQIGGYESCPQNLFADYWYCVHASHAAAAPKKAADNPPPQTKAPPVETVVRGPPRPTPPPQCEVNNCWRAFKKAGPQVKPSYRAWCSSVLESPAIMEANLDQFPGAPNMVKNQCTDLGDAHTVISSYCRCYNNYQI